MKICDKCGDKAVDEITLKSDDSRTDLCAGCRDKVLEVLRPSKPRGRPKLVKES